MPRSPRLPSRWRVDEIGILRGVGTPFCSACSACCPSLLPCALCRHCGPAGAPRRPRLHPGLRLPRPALRLPQLPAAPRVCAAGGLHLRPRRLLQAPGVAGGARLLRRILLPGGLQVPLFCCFCCFGGVFDARACMAWVGVGGPASSPARHGSSCPGHTLPTPIGILRLLAARTTALPSHVHRLSFLTGPCPPSPFSPRSQLRRRQVPGRRRHRQQPGGGGAAGGAPAVARPAPGHRGQPGGGGGAARAARQGPHHLHGNGGHPD
jgi:hypothetical protein